MENPNKLLKKLLIEFYILIGNKIKIKMIISSIDFSLIFIQKKYISNELIY
jgi:hypothetical protein